MVRQVGADLLRVSEVLALARRRRHWLLVAALGGTVLGFAWLAVSPPAYTSMAVVLVHGSPTESQLQREAQIAVSAAALAPVAEDTGVAGPAPRVRAESGDGDVVRIEVTAGSPAQAQRLAGLVTDRYMRYSADIVAQTAAGAAALLGPQRDNLQAQLEAADRRVAEQRDRPQLPATAPSPELAIRMPVPQLQALAGERSRLLQDLGGIESRIAEQILRADPARNLSLIGPPSRPPATSLLDYGLRLAAVAAAAVAVSLFLLVWRARRDPRLVTPSQIGAACAVPVTAVLPAPSSGLTRAEEQAHYERVAARITRQPATTEAPAAVRLLHVQDDLVAATAARRLTEAGTGAAALRVATVSHAWPVVEEVQPGGRCYLVVGSGVLTAPALFAVGAACRHAGAVPAGVLVVHTGASAPVPAHASIAPEQPSIVGA